jgi:hypothetical protein
MIVRYAIPIDHIKEALRTLRQAQIREAQISHLDFP